MHHHAIHRPNPAMLQTKTASSPKRKWRMLEISPHASASREMGREMARSSREVGRFASAPSREVGRVVEPRLAWLRATVEAAPLVRMCLEAMDVDGAPAWGRGIVTFWGGVRPPRAHDASPLDGDGEELRPDRGDPSRSARHARRRVEAALTFCRRCLSASTCACPS
uniref:Uncharacterized protein n=2 Tax=Prymnesium polylepis TaxID=72548 RepID=A0A7S4HGQ6_9EUKA|mmetsp:Transcript_35403/g.97986  ORF Transcript_35403/g.97986 Transcript_35403/m.97986 type:complete len:167 (-) Transcript_35403:1252-1752(-)